jgi:hypothetical protein
MTDLTPALQQRVLALSGLYAAYQQMRAFQPPPAPVTPSRPVEAITPTSPETYGRGQALDRAAAAFMAPEVATPALHARYASMARQAGVLWPALRGDAAFRDYRASPLARALARYVTGFVLQQAPTLPALRAALPAPARPIFDLLNCGTHPPWF